MILVTVGTEQFPFNRLINWMNLLIQKQLIQEKVVIQYGSCTVQVDGIEGHSLLQEEEFCRLVDRARLVISHCGEGSLLLLEEFQKDYILVPRSHLYGEHVDNHQVELAKALETKGVPIAWSPGDLTRFCHRPKKTFDLSLTSVNSLCEDLHQLCESWNFHRGSKSHAFATAK